ncbi:DUF6496 domain-containing protein [Paraburkholderia bannensis]|uniref:DUF6496 domain-containing protein n=1 Tax=Paraburkholderia bannensis TaxID=765414 RepID=UPI002AB30BE6|nr:DUF6496 domain-containing protein [Paraburkholderia bannensis]
MPEQKTLARARADKRAGKSASTQASEFVREEIERVRAGKHGVRSTKQAIAIGLSEARRAGVDLKAPAKNKASEATRKKAKQDSAAAGKNASKTEGKKHATDSASTARRSRAATAALKRESTAGASGAALSKQAKSAAARRPAASRSAAAKKAAQTKGAAGRSAAAKKAAKTRAARATHGHR